MLELRPYQIKALDDTRAALRESKKVILTMPTGSGKTAVAKVMIENAISKGLRAAFVVDRLSLLDQTCGVFEAAGLEYGVMQGDHYLTDYSKQFQICSAQTIARRGIGSFDLLIWDESHVMYRGLLGNLKDSNGTYFVGLTATPWTKGLGKYWEKLVTGPSSEELMKDGFLSQYKAYGPGKPDLSNVRISAGDYNKKDLSKATDKKEITGDIIDHWFLHAKERRTVVMAVDIAHAEHITEEFKKRDIKADVVHSFRKQHENQKSLIDFKDGTTQVLCSVDMISRGFDMPQADCLIIARPTKSLNYHIQAIGRILRPCEGKEFALILDHAGNIERLGFPDDEFDMVLDKGGKKRKMMCPFCGWEGSANLDEKCPICNLQTIAKKSSSKEKLPTPCSNCKTLFRGKECPNCGHERKRQSNVGTKEEMLIEMQKGRHGATPRVDKEVIFAKLLAGARVVGFKDGWAKYQYRNYFGTWPGKLVEPDKSFGNFLETIGRKKQMQILWSLTDGKR